MGHVTRKRRTAPPTELVGGLLPQIIEVDDGTPEKYQLVCPACGDEEVGRFRFPLLAKRAFEEHVDEQHPTTATPLDQVRTLVDLAETSPNTWVCDLAGDSYTVRHLETGRYEVEVTSRDVVIEAELGKLDEARVVIGSRAGLVTSALALAASVQLRRTAPDNAVALG